VEPTYRISDEEKALGYDAEGRKWTNVPALPSCWRDGGRLWFAREGADARDDDGTVVPVHEADGAVGRTYQAQMFCRHWQKFINPSGHTCDLCRARKWPEVERWVAHVIPAVIEREGSEGAEAALVAMLEDAVDAGGLTPAEAAQIEFALQQILAEG